MSIELSNEELQRYSRHLLLPEVGLKGQKKLKTAKVLCVGAGGLTSPAALYLAAAGVGHLGFIDGDIVALSNLQRQILYHTSDVGQKKVECAKEKLLQINPHINIQAHDIFLTAKNGKTIVTSYDLILDGSDNFSTRYLTNDLAFFLNKPLIYGSVFRFEGQCTLFEAHREGPCYRCLFPEPPPQGLIPSCSEAGVLGIVPGIIGTLQAMETLKWILNIGTSLRGRLLQWNALIMKFREFQIRKNPHCPLCGTHPTITTLAEEKISCTTSMNSDLSSIPTITVEELEKKLQQHHPIKLIDVREPEEYEIAHIEGSQLIPLGELISRTNELPHDEEIALLCRSGGRSAQALLWLQEAGFSKLYNVEGGILAWQLLRSSES
ncbi:MAG: molybdopterin-synthase adenylyltransferase MoeB [Verrucomicrobia bacterium]|nr:molybdopterin-synthase adenylyltransferase MoeB [Verrucomicrobiota bacterium]